jgi:hypothetical protein
MLTERRVHSLQRYQQYFDELRGLTAPQAQRPIALVQSLLDAMRAKVQSV